MKDPKKNVGRASLLGTAASAIVYLAVSAAVMGLVPHHALVNTDRDGERTTPMAVEILAQALFTSGQADQVMRSWNWTRSSCCHAAG